MQSQKQSRQAKPLVSRLSIGYWVLLGKALEENPDLSVQMLQDLLVSIKELRLNKVAKYSFG
jgi:hypothetical protein